MCHYNKIEKFILRNRIQQYFTSTFNLYELS